MTLCACGCGRLATRRYVKGHNGRVPLEERFWAKVQGGDVDSCWLWTGATDGHAYGQINVDGQPVKAHRVAWALLRGDIPEALTVDHLCFTTLCVNPWHMELVSPAENSRRVRANQHTAKTHCHRGHLFDAANTRRLGRGRRGCRKCDRITERARRKAQRSQIAPTAPAAGTTTAA